LRPRLFRSRASRAACATALLTLAPLSPAGADELVRVRVSQFTGAEPATISSATHPSLFWLADEIESATLTAVNPALSFKEDDGPGNWFPVMTPPLGMTPAGYIELSITPEAAMPVRAGGVTFQNGAKFPGNPSSFQLRSSLDGYASTIATVDTSEENAIGVAWPHPSSTAAFGFRWVAGSDFGDFGGGQAGFSGQDLIVREACSATPRGLCGDLAASSISWQRGAKSKLKWSGGDPRAAIGGAPAAIALDDFGAPGTASGSSYDVCLYDDGVWVGQLLLGPGGLCGGKPCWKAGSSSTTYKGKAGLSEGITSLSLRAGQKSNVGLAGGGANLALPDMLTNAVSLRVQLVRSSIASNVFCLESTFDAPADLNDGTRFKDRSP
jgi:hypothetical protein